MYGISKKVELSYDECIAKVTEELKKEGFGILVTIDVKDTLKKKLDVDFDRYIILGACNPQMAYQALQSEREIGLLLPCNVIVYEQDGDVYVSAMNPAVAMSVVPNNPDLAQVASRVKEKLERVIEAV